MKKFQIHFSKRKICIGSGHPVFIVAELSANHQQKIKKAYKLIDAAVQSGADAVKIQTFKPNALTINSNKKWFRVKVNKAWRGQTLYQLYEKAYTPWEWQPKLKAYAQKKGIIFFSTPFDNSSVDFLEKMKVALYKIASFEVIDIPLLKKIGRTKKPVIMSRGMSSEHELRHAIKTLKESGCPTISILHCISSYPATFKEMNLATIPKIAEKFNLVPGLSDHSLDNYVPIIAVALGARIIEKHLTLKRSDGGLDAAFSLEPMEFKEMVQNIRKAEKIIGNPCLEVGKKEKNNIIFRRSLFTVQDIKKGEVFTEKNIRSIRPGYGLPPKYYNEILGKIANCDIERGTPLSWDLIVK